MATFSQITSVGSNGTANMVLAQTYDSNVTILSKLLAWVFSESTTATVSLTDSQGNTWTQIGSYQSVSPLGRASIWQATASATGSLTVTGTLSASGEWSMFLEEYTTSTSLTLDGNNGGTGTSSAPATGSITVTSSPGLVVAGYLSSPSTVGHSGPSGYTARAISNTSTQRFRIADNTAASTGSVVFAQSASSQWAALGASFSEASPPPSPPVASTIYQGYRAGPPIRGMPWTMFIPRPQFELMAYPASQPPPPPTPPIPIPPPPPPGVPPTYPPLPPAPDFEDVSDLVDIDKRIDPRLARVLEINSAIWNSLLRTGQVIRDPQSDNPLSWRIVAPTWGGLTGAYGLAGYYVSNIEVYQGLVQAITITPLPSCDCDCECDDVPQVPADPFDPWSGAGAPNPTTVFPFMVTVLFRGAGGEAQTLNIVASPNNIVPGTLVGSTGLLSGGTVPTGVYNAPAGGTTLWGLYPGAWYVGFVTAATDDRFEMVDPVGTIENPDNAAWHDYVLINVNADGTVTTGVGGPTSGAFTVSVLVPP